MQDTTISLSSSLTNIGTVDQSIIIPKDTTYASASFTSTFSPGTTAISASATGYATIQSSINTVGPIPHSVAVYGFPSTLPPDGSYDAIMVQLQDSSGTPAKAPKDGVLVSLSSSNTSIGKISPNVTIAEGKTYAIATFNTTSAAQDEGKVKSVIVTTVAQGYISQQVTMTITPLATNPTQLKIFSGPTQIPADQSTYRQIAIELQNASGFVGVLPSDVMVTVGSSDPNIAEIDSQITLPQSQTYTVAALNTTYKAGSTTITAVATDLLRNQQTVTTTGFTPSKLAVYCAPSVLASDKGTYQSIQVQLQDSQGRPAKDPQIDVNLNLFSSQPIIGTVCSTLTIPFGQTQATGTLTVTNTPGSTAITAQASSYTTGQGTITTYIIDFLPLQITATTDSASIQNAQKTNVTVYVTADDNPLTGATIKFASDNSGSFTASADQGNGYYKTVFTAPSFAKATTCTLTATVSKTGYVTSQATTQVTVQPASATTPTTTPTTTIAPTNQSETSTPAATNSTTGIIQMRIEDCEGNPLSNATVYSTTQPTGVAVLTGTTNSSGYITFSNVTAGKYSVCIVMDGYEQLNQTINYTGQSTKMSLTLNSESTSAPGNNNILLIAIVIVVVVVVIIIIGLLFISKRRHVNEPFNQSNFKLSSAFSQIKGAAF